VAHRCEDLSGRWTVVTDGFGDAPVTQLGLEAARRRVVGHDELHTERNGQRGREG
jgi:hypothetical protein